MIPLHLKITGFLSYQQPVELDFTSFELACIAGPNGAGKSSLLDAITWALFGQARKRDDSLVNAQSSVAEVSLIFLYEDNLYKVVRTLERGKSTKLEVQIFRGEKDTQDWSLLLENILAPQAAWKPITEHSVRETQARIEKTLRLDYETFVNASFFLQGKADQFTQQRSGDRKRILSSILGLDAWEVYRQRAAEQRKQAESEVEYIEGRMAEISTELAEEEGRKDHLKQLETSLARLTKTRQAQELTLEALQKAALALAEQRKLVNVLALQSNEAAGRLGELETRLASRQGERQGYAQLLGREPQIRLAYSAWQDALQSLAKWDDIAARFRDHEKRRQEPLTAIETERARLEQELVALRGQETQLNAAADQRPTLEGQLEDSRRLLVASNEKLARRTHLDGALRSAHQSQAEAGAENPVLKTAMQELKERIEKLSASEGATCPLCGQPLAEGERQALITSLEIQGRDMASRFRANKSLLEQADLHVQEIINELDQLADVESERIGLTETVTRLAGRLDQIAADQKAWSGSGTPRLADIQSMLVEGNFAPDAHLRLAEIDAELKSIGYDASAHDEARRQEALGRPADTELRSLEKAHAALAPLDREIAGLASELERQREEANKRQGELSGATAALEEAEAHAPDVFSAEKDLDDTRESENRLRMEVGAARQKVLVLDDLKTRRKAFQDQRQDLARLVSQYKQLERAFGKDGVPALLIEQALPEIESRSNEILDRLSGGNMTVRFATQVAFKDKKREDLKEALDIQISDGAGTRDYEMFSGGEAFRVNFAIRLALSKVLAGRAGARLQTLVIDEGFGSQDAEGRQRLVEAINLVRGDFARILVITHIDELKDAFPNRIEVEKTPQGSTVRVI